MPQVTLYTKPGCHLCETVEQTIRYVAKRRRFRYVRKNILDDAGDMEKYQNAIPVVVVNGKEVARYRLTQAEFETALAEASEL